MPGFFFQTKVVVKGQHVVHVDIPRVTRWYILGSLLLIEKLGFEF